MIRLPNEYRRPQYNPQTIANPEDLAIQTDSAGYHEIKVYNDTKDSMWSVLSIIKKANTKDEIMAFADQLELVFLRADGIWVGIQESAMIKARSMKIGEGKQFKYDGDMLKSAKDVEKYLDYFRKPSRFVDEYGQPEKDFKGFVEGNTEAQKLEVVKEKLGDIVKDAYATWNKYEAKLGMGLPLKIAEEKDIFFRD